MKPRALRLSKLKVKCKRSQESYSSEHKEVQDLNSSHTTIDVIKIYII